jgi:hypothetical protein
VAYLQKATRDLKFWRTTLVIEAAFCLHNFCIDERELTVLHFGSCDPSAFTPNYEEYLDPLGGEDDTPKRKRHAVHEVIVQKITADGHRRPRYNIT